MTYVCLFARIKTCKEAFLRPFSQERACEWAVEKTTGSEIVSKINTKETEVRRS